MLDEVNTHLFEVGGRGFLLDVEGGNLYSLSSQAYELASANITNALTIDNLTFDKWKAWRELSLVLRRVKPLTEAEVSNRRQQIETQDVRIVGFWLGLAHTCNLACKYCFANEPAYLRTPKMMSWGVARQAIDFLIAKEPHQDEFSLTFFGGEPLLNFKVLQRTLSYCRKLEEAGKHFNFSITTNGTLLTRGIYDQLRANNVSMMISIDGTQEIHDAHRRFRNGGPSWGTILRNLDKLPDWPDWISTRATILNANTPLQSIFDNLSRLGSKRIVLGEACPNSGSPPTFPMEQHCCPVNSPNSVITYGCYIELPSFWRSGIQF